MEKIWWGQFQLAEGKARQWEIGPLKLTIQRLRREWWLAHEQINAFDKKTTIWKGESTEVDVDATDYANRERYAFNQTDEILSVLPALADRPVVIRPITPLSVPPGEAVTVFASTPLWVQIAVEDPPKRLKEMPIDRPSDTWFGPSTTEGELSYAIRTHSRLNFENVPIRPHRAITQIRIRNRANNLLLVERFSLPAPYLSLFGTTDGLLWTQFIIMTRKRETGMAAELRMGHSPPAEAKDAQLISGPRRTPSRNMIVRAFGSLFR